ncbi:hypothetical protein NC651_013935 [Populus alba x Populus x berolinensis]|nr:hypothetical protein NC651_013935 [Populus alba x Populus x berolinensis]
MMTSTRIHCLIEDDEITVMPRCYESYCRENLMFSAGFILGYALSADLLDKPNLISPPNIRHQKWLPYIYQLPVSISCEPNPRNNSLNILVLYFLSILRCRGYLEVW